MTSPQTHPPVAVVRPSNWGEAVGIGKHLIRWAFRGHGSSSWELASTLERAALAADSPFGLLRNRERWIRIQFARRAHHYLSDPPDPDRHVEWLALIQHHGGPTRLLDFTHSFYVAAFFALERATEESAVWAVNLDRLEAPANSIVGYTRDPQSTIYDQYQRYLAAAERMIADGTGPKSVLPVEPERLNERLSIQQGIFLMGCDVTAGFQDNLAGSLGVNVDALQATLEVPPRDISVIEADRFALIKILLPHSLRYDAINDLERMNISAATLFPGLDGFARSLFVHFNIQLTATRMRRAGVTDGTDSRAV